MSFNLRRKVSLGGGWDKVRSCEKTITFRKDQFLIRWGGGRDKNQPARYRAILAGVAFVFWGCFLSFFDLGVAAEQVYCPDRVS
jgi:hypothetical protein